jgi:hypothetical protein
MRHRSRTGSTTPRRGYGSCARQHRGDKLPCGTQDSDTMPLGIPCRVSYSSDRISAHRSCSDNDHSADDIALDYAPLAAVDSSREFWLPFSLSEPSNQVPCDCGTRLVVWVPQVHNTATFSRSMFVQETPTLVPSGSGRICDVHAPRTVWRDHQPELSASIPAADRVQTPRIYSGRVQRVQQPDPCAQRNHVRVPSEAVAHAECM